MRVLKLQKALAKYEEFLYSDKFNIFQAFIKITIIISFFAHCLACMFWAIGSNSAADYGESWTITKGFSDDDVLE